MLLPGTVPIQTDWTTEAEMPTRRTAPRTHSPPFYSEGFPDEYRLRKDIDRVHPGIVGWSIVYIF